MGKLLKIALYNIIPDFIQIKEYFDVLFLNKTKYLEFNILINSYYTKGPHILNKKSFISIFQFRKLHIYFLRMNRKIQ
jgi:hypothetical protein